MTDFIDFQVWPIFNLADTAIVVGAIVLAFSNLGDRAEGDGVGARPGDAGRHAPDDPAA